MRKHLFFLMVLLICSFGINAQDYTFDDFVGTWNGYISGNGDLGQYSDPMTMTIYEDGYYTETSGHLMPTLYPDTQQSEFDPGTNRYHWWYLYLVYSGQYFYQHFYYEVVHFQNDTLIMHYNFWDDPEPHPEVGTIFLVKEVTTGIGDSYPNSNVSNKKLLKVYDLTGREVKENTTGTILIYLYDDGTTEKKFVVPGL